MGRPTYLTAHLADWTGPFTRQADKSSDSIGNFECTYFALLTEPTAGSGKGLLVTGVDDLFFQPQEILTSTK